MNILFILEKAGRDVFFRKSSKIANFAYNSLNNINYIKEQTKLTQDLKN